VEEYSTGVIKEFDFFRDVLRSALPPEYGLTSFWTAPCCTRSKRAFGIAIRATLGYNPPTRTDLIRFSCAELTLYFASSTWPVPINPIWFRADKKSCRKEVMSRTVDALMKF